MEDLKVISLTKSMLRADLSSNTYWKGQGHIPFSKSKAQWLLLNDRIDEDDVCAVMCLEKDTLISFIFLIPDFIRTKDGSKKVYFSSRWWVDEKYKGSIQSTYTRQFSFGAVKNQLIIKIIGKDTKDFYVKQPFKKFAKRSRYIILFSFDYNLLVDNIKGLKKLSFFVKIASTISYRFVKYLNVLKNKKKTKSLSYEYMSYIDETTWTYISDFCKNDLVIKDKNYLNWQVNNNQYINTPTKEKKIFKSAINNMSDTIYNINFLVKKNNNNVGFISALIRGNAFNVRYFLTNEENFDLCVDALIDNFIHTKSTIIETENEKLGARIKEKYTNLYTNKRVLESIIHNDVNEDLSQIEIQDQDANYA